MRLNRVLFRSQTSNYGTPKALYQALDAEFNFNYDPCPLSDSSIDGLLKDWGTVTYCNPPYGKDIYKWISKGYLESEQGKIVVMLLPSRTDTKWWHSLVMKANEIRFIKGRLKFGDSINNAPFPSVIVIFRG